MNLDLPITAIILSLNEEDNIERTLSSLRWIPYVVLVDSGSNDATLSLANKFANVSIVYHQFVSFANQCNYALGHCVLTPWVLSLDADYCISKELAEEISHLFADPQSIGNYVGFQIPFTYCIEGYPIRGSILPPRTCLYKAAKAIYCDEGHGHRVILDGDIGKLHNHIMHDDRKPISRWLHSQEKYMCIEAKTLISTPTRYLPFSDRIRKHTVLAPILVFLFSYIYKLGLLDGPPGLVYAIQRSYAELLLLLHLQYLKVTNSRFQKRRKLS